jgi:MFS family permease
VTVSAKWPAGGGAIGEGSLVGGNFGRLLAATAITNVGDGIRLVALPLLATLLTRDPVLIAAVTAAVRLPWLLASLPAGVLADRCDRRALMGYGALGQTVLVGALSLAVLADRATIGLVIAIAFAMGCLEVVIDNTAQVITPQTVAPAQLDQANGLLVAAFILANQFAGPPIGGVLFAVSASAPFGVDALTFAVAAALLLSMRGAFCVAAEPAAAGMRVQIAEGVRWLRRDRPLSAIAAACFVQNLFESMSTSILVLFALKELGLSGVGFGLLVTAGSLGGLAGTRSSRALSGWLGVVPVLLGTNLAMGVSKGAIGLVGNPVVVGLLFAVNGFAVVVWNVVTVTVRQRVIPGHLLGRVNSVYRLVAWAGIPFGALFGGAIASEFGLRTPFLVEGVAICILTALLALRLPKPWSATAEAR